MAFVEGCSIPLAIVPGEITPDLVREVSRHVVSSWASTATPESLVQLKDDRPTIPSDLDRALLLDLASRGDVDYIDDAARHDLRAAFWQTVDALKVR